MKDFLKWLGVNDKVAKVLIWMFIAMVFLIVINAALDSLGFPYYKLTVENLSHINTTKALDMISNLVVTCLNFYTFIFLVFSIKDFKKTLKYLLLYVVLNFLINSIFGYAIAQIFIIVYILGFCYLFSNKNPKYILYGIISIVINTVVQYLWYAYKVSLLEYDMLTGLDRILLSIDYFIIMFVIILVKEFIMNKRRDKKCLEEEQQVGCGLENLTKKSQSPKK